MKFDKVKTQYKRETKCQIVREFNNSGTTGRIRTDTP